MAADPATATAAIGAPTPTSPVTLADVTSVSDFAVPNSRRAAAASTHETGANAGAPEPPPKSTANAEAADVVHADEDTTDTGAATATAPTAETAAIGAALGTAVTDRGFATAAVVFPATDDATAAAGFDAACAARLALLPADPSPDDAASGECRRCLPPVFPAGRALPFSDVAEDKPSAALPVESEATPSLPASVR